MTRPAQKPPFTPVTGEAPAPEMTTPEIPRWCACLGTPEPPPTWYFIEGHDSNGPTDRCGFGDDENDEGWFDMNTSDAYEGSS